MCVYVCVCVWEGREIPVRAGTCTSEIPQCLWEGVGGRSSTAIPIYNLIRWIDIGYGLFYKSDTCDWLCCQIHPCV